MSVNAGMALQRVLHDLPSAGLTTFLALFPIVNPFGGIPLFFSLTTDFTPAERRHTALKTALYVIAILVAFMLFGRFVLSFFGISLPVLKIAGGLIVANTAWGMVTGSSRLTHDENHEALTKEDISLTPMAMPMLSGPGSIGVVMGLAAHADSFLVYVGMILGILAIGLTVYLFLRFGRPLRQDAWAGCGGRNRPHFWFFDPGDSGATRLGRGRRFPGLGRLLTDNNCLVRCGRVFRGAGRFFLHVAANERGAGFCKFLFRGVEGVGEVALDTQLGNHSFLRENRHHHIGLHHISADVTGIRSENLLTHTVC